MKISKHIQWLMLAFWGMGLLASDSWATQKILELKPEDIQAAQATQLNLLFLVGTATMTSTPSADTDYIIRAVVDYSDDQLEPTLQLASDSGKLTATFISGTINGTYPPGTVHNWQILTGSYETPTNLSFNLGAVSADLDCGGMPLLNYICDFGGSQINADFSTPTQLPLNSIMINCGGAALNMTNIGNTDFDLLALNSGGVLTMLDFSGALTAGKHIANIVLAGSLLDVQVPTTAGELIKAVTVASTFQITGEGWLKQIRRPSYKMYMTDGYNTDAVQINVNIQSAGSAIKIER